jgi:hypothetical protein
MGKRNQTAAPADPSSRGVFVRLAPDDVKALGEHPTARAREILQAHLRGDSLTLGQHLQALAEERRAANAEADRSAAEIEAWDAENRAITERQQEEIGRLRRELQALRAAQEDDAPGHQGADDDPQERWSAGYAAGVILGDARTAASAGWAPPPPTAWTDIAWHLAKAGSLRDGGWLRLRQDMPAEYGAAFEFALRATGLYFRLASAMPDYRAPALR